VAFVFLPPHHKHSFAVFKKKGQKITQRSCKKGAKRKNKYAFGGLKKKGQK
jgi:hypothetical protein